MGLDGKGRDWTKKDALVIRFGSIATYDHSNKKVAPHILLQNPGHESYVTLTVTGKLLSLSNVQWRHALVYRYVQQASNQELRMLLNAKDAKRDTLWQTFKQV